MKEKIIVVGSLNADFVVRVERFPVPGETVRGLDFGTFPGGKGANQAYAAARLGGHVGMVGQVGRDAQGAWLKENLAQVGVDVSHVREEETTGSGVAVISLDRSGQNHIVIVPGANGAFTPSRLEAAGALLAGARLLLLQLEIPLETVEAAARRAKEAGALVILDPAPARELPDALLQLSDYLTPNESELATLTGRVSGEGLSRDEVVTAARTLLARGAARVIVKLGARGALMVTRDEEYAWPPAMVKAVDTTAAGDAFNAGLAVALAEGLDVFEAGRFATAVAACSVTRAGAQPSLPSRAEAEALFRQLSRGPEFPSRGHHSREL